MIIIVRFQPGEWSLISHNMFWEISKPPQLARLSLEISIWDKIFTSICHQSQPLPHLVIRWRQTGGADCENWWHEARPSTHLEWDNFYNQTEFLRLQSRRVMKPSSLLPAWYDLAHSLNTFILLYLLKVTINIWSRLWRRIVGLDRISLKPILSLWSGNTGAGSDGKLFVVKLISLLSPPPLSAPQHTTCNHKVLQEPRSTPEWFSHWSDQKHTFRQYHTQPGHSWPLLTSEIQCEIDSH